MIIARIPRILSRTFKSLTWEVKTKEQVVYLTFDDGPTPEVTNWVLDSLDTFDAKATFFCLGKNVKANPELYREIKERGHSVGNHSFSHLKGFRTPVEAYKKDVDRARELIDSTLFRPPYGRILPAQAKRLSENYTIIMWSVLSVDYNPKVSSEQVIQNVIDNVGPGSIIVFHDSLKARKNLYAALPEVLEYLHENNYSMQCI